MGAPMWSDHMRIEQRSLALHQVISQHLRENPDLLQIARNNLERWVKRDGEIPPWKEWKEILRKPLTQIVDVIVSKTEKGRQLRQSSPFCGVLTPKERWKIYESFTIGAYYQSSGEHRQ